MEGAKPSGMWSLLGSSKKAKKANPLCLQQRGDRLFHRGQRRGGVLTVRSTGETLFIWERRTCPKEGWQGGLGAGMCLEERNVRAEWEDGNWYPREVVLTATWARLTSRSGLQKHQCGHSRTEVVLRYFDLQARNYIPVLILLSSPLTSLPKSNMESFYQASFFFSFLGGPGGGGWSCTAWGTLFPDCDFLPSAVEAWRTHSWTTSKVPVSVPSIRFASFGRICTQSHSYNDDDLAIVIQTFLINYYCLLLLENFSF